MRDLAEAKHGSYIIRSKYYYTDNRYSLHDKICSTDFLNFVKKFISDENYFVFNKKPWTYISLEDRDSDTARWKIHISANNKNYINILEIVARYAISNQINFKFAMNYKEFVHLNSKNIERISSGKFIVLYPKEDIFEQTLEDLYVYLKGYEGPYILTDKPYKDSKVIYYRYGEIMPIHILDEYGTINTYVINNENELAEDVRKPHYVVPKYINDKNYTIEKNIKSKLLQKYKISESLHFTSQGGVYVGTIGDQKYLIKESREYCGLDYSGNYGSDRLKKEYSTMKYLEGLDCVPKAIEIISDCGNLYLVEEFVNGNVLSKFAFKQSPVVNCSREDLTINKQFEEKYIKILILIVKSIQKIHDRGVIFNDISPNNIMYDDELNKLYFIDYEACYHVIDECNKVGMKTPGFGCTEEGTPIQFDLYKLALIFLHCIMPFNSIYDLISEKAFVAIEFLRELNVLPNYIYDLIDKLLKFEFTDCEEVLKFIDYNSKIQEKIECSKINKKYTLDNSIEDICKVKTSIIENIDPRENIMVACDPMGYLTSEYSFGFGVFGVLYALNFIKEGKVVEKSIIDKIVKKFMVMFYKNPGFQTNSLYVGYSGIVVSLLELGYENEAKIIMDYVTKQDMSMDDISYGLAGRIIAELCTYKETKNTVYLSLAQKDADTIIDRAIVESGNYYWKDKQGDIYIGLTRGSSGIALAMLYLYNETGDCKYLEAATNAFESDYKKTLINEYNYRSFNSIPKNDNVEDKRIIYSPYMHNGISGIGTVALRFYLITKDERYKDIVEDVIKSCDFDFSLFPGYLRGTTGVISFLQDCCMHIDSKKAYEILCTLTYRIKFYRVNLKDIENDLDLNGYVGDELLRISHDFFTGSSGIISVLYRNYTLKEKTPNPFVIMDKYYTY